MHPSPHDAPNQSLRFFRIMHEVGRGWNRILPRPGPFALLVMIHNKCRLDPECPGVPVSEISRTMHHSVAAASQKIRALEEEGYVQRITPPNDRRVCYIRLTDSGTRAALAAMRQFDDCVESILDTLGAEKTEQLFSILQDLSDVLQTAEPFPFTQDS